VLLLRQAAGRGAHDAQVRYGLSADDRLYLEACGRGQGLLVTPRGHVRLQVTPSPWELELMGGPRADPQADPQAGAGADGDTGGTGNAGSTGHSNTGVARPAGATLRAA
jgi:hypothetical protein